MIRLLYLVILLSGFVSSALSMDPKATIEWKETSINFGNIPFDKPVTVVFIFKNPGMVPLVINKVDSSCGCTVADYPKEPIVSGVEGKITVTYDAKTEGYFSKTISIFSNIEGGITQLYISGVVVK